ncbi:hypothetical protein J7E90_31475, partial [Streptomyces sp. ISL-111]|uniref:hypothetical protein n=1 Tax=Streptomyces sp. ISL-111 TaxID=2819175 RepID=UPI001BECD055
HLTSENAPVTFGKTTASYDSQLLEFVGYAGAGCGTPCCSAWVFLQRTLDKEKTEQSYATGAPGSVRAR